MISLHAGTQFRIEGELLSFWESSGWPLESSLPKEHYKPESKSIMAGPKTIMQSSERQESVKIIDNVSNFGLHT